MSAVDIIVPVFNEEACLDEFYARVQRLGQASALIFVDNGSTDGTPAHLARFTEARVIRHTTNEGYGSSVRDAFTLGDGERIVIIDSDLEYPPEIVPAVLDALCTHPVVYTSRFLSEHSPDIGFTRRLGNRLVSGLYNLLFGQRVTDLLTGCKGFRRDTLAPGSLRTNGFEHSIEFGALFALAGHRIHEIPIDYRPRTRGASKMRHFPQVLRMLAFLAMFWLRYAVLRRPLPRTPADAGGAAA